jgi:Na+-driven multidrug efflux pump
MNYGLVLGHFGLPALGVRGAAISALTTRCLECTTLLLFVYLKKLPAAASLRELTDFPAGFVQRYFKVATVVVLNEVFWSTGATMLSAVYAHISTDAIAAMNIARAIQGLSLFVSGATMTACAILVGNKIGEGQTETAERYANWSLITGAIGSIAAGLLIIGASTWLLNIYQIPQETRTAAYWIVVIYGLTQWIRTIDGTIIVGILRSGGDTLFSGIVDVASVWLVALPAVYLGGIVLGLPIEWVALISMVESTFKVCLGLPRVRSRKWINNLAAG